MNSCVTILDMKKNKIDKHYQLINSRYKLSIVEQKLVLSIISLIRPTDDDFMNYQIPINQFDFLNDNRNATRLKKYCKDLMSKPLEIETENGFKIFNWFAHIEYDKKSSMLECSVSPKLKPYLIKLQENFKSYDLKYILNMQSEYSIRIYEMLKKSEKIGYVILNLEELQDLLQVPKSFKVYADFKRKILNVACKEIAQYTDIYFDFEEIKVGRKVVEIKCLIYKNRHNLESEENYEFKQFRELMIEKYEGHPIIYHDKIERHIMVENRLLVVQESGKIIRKDQALAMWNYIYKNKSKLITLPMNME